MSGTRAYIIAARRAANGRLGGLHRHRRLEELAAPVLVQTLADAAIEPGQVDMLVLGNTTQGNNPGRLVALLAGLPDRCVTYMIDRHSASGLEAIASAMRCIATGEADIVAAGGAEALSTAPWRLAKPRTLYHMPRFVGLAQADDGPSGEHTALEATEGLATRLGITRAQQDEFAIADHIRATLARDARRLAKEIVPLRGKAEEARDELVGEPDIDDLEAFPALLGEGSLTAGNTSLPADGAAFVVAVSERAYRRLGQPPALVLKDSVSVGVAPSSDIEAPIVAARLLGDRMAGASLDALAALELGEASAVQAITFLKNLSIQASIVNADGGQVARGQPVAAASAILLVRLFTRLVRVEEMKPGAIGAAVIGAAGGQAMAALFERA